MLPEALDRYQYLLLMGACLAITLPLQLFLRARVYTQPRRLLLALAPTVVLFSAWDILGIIREHWWYSPRYTTGWMVPFTPMPVEELAFFLVIPVCGLLTYGAVGTVLGWARHWAHRPGAAAAMAPRDDDPARRSAEATREDGPHA